MRPAHQPNHLSQSWISLPQLALFCLVLVICQIWQHIEGPTLISPLLSVSLAILGLNSKIQALVDSQTKMMVMFEKVADRISQIEKVVSSNSASSSHSTSTDEKARVPPLLSVCNYM